jgi:aminopeptidase N
VTLTTPAGYQSATSGTATRKSPVARGAQTQTIEAAQSRDFVIEISKLFEQKNAIRGSTVIRSYFLGKHRDSGAAVLDAAAKAFDYYSSAFGPYPYTELDVVESPLYGGAGGVEFPGLVTIASMLYSEPATDDSDTLQQLLATSPMTGELLEFVVAHEVAHQWWNSTVGSNSKKYPYIDEAMANYSAVLYFEHYYGRQVAERQMAMQMKLNYQVHRFAGGPDRPVNLPASSYNGPLEYAGIVYGKGALYFDDLRKVMGDAAFFDALKRYYNEYWFRIAGPDALTAIAEQRAPDRRDTIRATFKRWIQETHGDEDIGKGTLEALIPTLLSTKPDVMSEDQQELLKQFEDLLKMLGDTQQ